MRKIMKTLYFLLAMVMLLSSLPMIASATTSQTEVVGKYYEFDKDSHYEFHEADTSEPTSTEITYGTFYINGNIATNGNKSGVPSYEVADSGLSIYYNYGDTKLNANEDAWHLINDKSNKVADMKLGSDIMKGAIILQTSKDRKNWVDVQTIYNAFSDTPIRTSAIYSATDVELINGCFYRVVVVYELSIRTEDSNFLFINTDKYDYKKCAEVYEFYAYTNSGENTVVDHSQTYSLGEKVRAKNFGGYFGEELIKQDDVAQQREAVYAFYDSWRKTLQIDNLRAFLSNCYGIDRVVVLGHSMSAVDAEYMELVEKSLHPRSWEISYHDPNSIDDIISQGYSFDYKMRFAPMKELMNA